MPRFNNTIHSTTVAGQIYSRGVPNAVHGFVGLTLNNYSMLRQIVRYDKSLLSVKK